MFPRFLWKFVHKFLWKFCRSSPEGSFRCARKSSFEISSRTTLKLVFLWGYFLEVPLEILSINFNVVLPLRILKNLFTGILWWFPRKILLKVLSKNFADASAEIPTGNIIFFRNTFKIFFKYSAKDRYIHSRIHLEIYFFNFQRIFFKSSSMDSFGNSFVYSFKDSFRYFSKESFRYFYIAFLEDPF